MRLLFVPAMLYTVPAIKWPEAPLAGAASFKGIFWLLPFLWHGYGAKNSSSAKSDMNDLSYTKAMPEVNDQYFKHEKSLLLERSI